MYYYNDSVEETYGVKQIIEEEGERKQQMLDRLEEMKQYMETVVAVDPKYKNVRETCENQEPDCLLWAESGECKNNYEYMTFHCAPACQTCDQLDILNRCPLDPNAANMLEHPGDLNRMFERILSDPTIVETYKPKVLSRPRPFPEEDVDYQEGPWVVIFDTFLTDHECDALVELGAEEGYERSGLVGVNTNLDGSFENLVGETRTSENAWCVDDCYENATAQVVMEKIENLTGFPETNSENLQMLKYEVGQAYKTHHDYIDHHQNRQCGARMLTLFLYLNDVDEGGGTNFPDLDLTVMPQKGRAVLWPSILDDEPGIQDSRTEHQALPVVRGIKYGANAWLHQRDFKTPNENECI
jgi:prolyl 4-hydroxylase